MSNAFEKLARSRIQFSQFALDVVHQAGIKHQVADTLSSLSTEVTDEIPLRDYDPVQVLTLKIFAKDWKSPKQYTDKSVANEQTVDGLVPSLPEVGTQTAHVQK